MPSSMLQTYKLSSHQHTRGSNPALLASLGSLGCFPQNKISVRPHVHRLSVAKLFDCTSWFFAHKFSHHKWGKTANSHVQELLQPHLSVADLHRIDLRAKVPVYTLQRTKSTNSWIRGNCLVCLLLSSTHRMNLQANSATTTTFLSDLKCPFVLTTPLKANLLLLWMHTSIQ